MFIEEKRLLSSGVYVIFHIIIQRVFCVRKYIMQIRGEMMGSSKGFILCIGESGDVFELIGISDDDDMFCSVEQRKGGGDIALRCLIDY